MTDERFERIEHLTAGLAEERRKDRDEYKALWRDTQRQIDANARAIAQLTTTAAGHAYELGELRILMRDLAEENRATNERIDKLISAVGALTQLVPPRQ